MTKKKLIRAMSLVLCGAIGATCMSTVLAGCKKRDSIVLMTEELSGLFNPFYATSGPDNDVVGMTQLSMITTDNGGNPVVGDDLATAVKAFKQEEKATTTEYTFVLKNGLKFSDGKPLTMNDVLFNMYVYLDPVYTGSSTMYSTDIVGLSDYRTQTRQSSGGSDVEGMITSSANEYARERRRELLRIYENNARQGGSTSTSFYATVADMEGYINDTQKTVISKAYKDAVATTEEQKTLTDADYRAKLLEDYKYTRDEFKKELEADFKAAKESYDTTNPPYSEWKGLLANDIFKFFLYEGYITPKYAKLPNSSRDDKTKIEDFENKDIVNNYKDEASAIERVYDDNIKTGLNQVLTAWGTAGTIVTQYASDATEILIKNRMGTKKLVPNIEGIVSLGHTTSENTVTVNGVTYNVAHDHNEDGTPKKDGEYDVLRIKINGIDPKAIYNFGFPVAPAHYYSADADHPDGRTIDIANDEFGVDYASSSFQSRVIQSQQHQEIPVGAGPYQATNSGNADNPAGKEFWSSNMVYFKANHNFLFDVKTEKVRMQVVSASNALDKLQRGEVDYVEPQFTFANSTRVENMVKKGFGKLESWQLGYGYIGINAGKVPKLGVRKAIMSAMQTELAKQYYRTGSCDTIDWPMSNRSWAYPKGINGHDYTQWTGEEDAIAKIKNYAAGATASDLKITFTIAGASITEHPTYAVFKQAAEILNNVDMGNGLRWEVEVKADSQALTKLSTGSLQVWAAAWGSTIDPDMYQVYHKKSKATSVYAWGYREILAAPSTYSTEYDIITNDLSPKIEEARSITDQGQRATLYKEAMSFVLDLAVELPVYQRQNLYAYNSKRIKGFPEKINEYSSPLEKIWELELIG